MPTIVTKNSSTASAVPSSSDLVQGELAVNVADKRLFTEDDSATVIELGTAPSSITTGAVSASSITSSGAIQGTVVTATTNFAGNITGNLTGNSAGTHTGAVTGNVTGNITGTGSSSLTTLATTNLTAGGLTFVTSDGAANQVLGTDGAGALQWLTTTTYDLASQAEAEAGTVTTGRIFSPLRVKQAIDSLAVTTADFGTGVGTFLATPSSANLRTAVTDETGTGSLVFATSPTLVTPVLGTPASGTATNLTGLPAAGVVGTAAILGANTFTALQTQAAGADIASATAVDLTAATGNVVVITGTTTTTSFTMTKGQQMVLIAAAAWPLTFHATTMNIVGGVSYTCAAGDRLYVVKDDDDVIRVSVNKQDGTAVVSASGAASQITVANEATDTTCFPTFVTAATGDLGPKSNAGLTFNSNTNSLATTTFVGALTGNASGSAGSVAVGNITGAGTGVLTALAVNVGSAGAPVVLDGALGTPSGGTLTNATGLPISTGVSGLATNVATFLGTPSSANLASAVTDETGSGALVFGTSPTFVTPALGTPASGVATNLTGTASGLTAGTVTTNANLTGHITSTGNAAVLGSFTSAQLATALTNETGSGAAVFGTSPTLVTPALGTPASGVMTNATGLPLTTGVTGTLPVANGGTGATSLTANNVVLGNGTSAVQVVAPSTSGNVLTSNGSTWQSTAPAPSGGVREFTASGTIPNGDIVTLNADGTVQVVASSLGDVEFGSSAVFDATNAYLMLAKSACYDPVANRVVIFYYATDSGDTQAVVGTVTAGDNSITFGTPVAFHTAGYCGYTTTAYNPDEGNILIAYRWYSGGGSGYSIVGTISGDTISFGTPVQFTTNDVYDIGSCYDTTANKHVISYKDYNNSQYGTAIIATVSGTTITYGTSVVFNTEITNDSFCAYDPDEDKTVIVYKDVDGTNYGTAIVGTVSGTSISFGTAVVFESANSSDPTIAYDPDENKMVIAYSDGGNSGAGTGIVGTVSGTSISFGTAAVFESGDTNYIALVYHAASSKWAIFYQEDGASSGASVVGTVSGTGITFGTPLAFESATTDYICAAYDSSAARIAVGYRNGGNSNYGTSIIFNQGISTDVNDEVGIAAEAGTDTNPIDITIIGGINASQSGLTVGADYWATFDGKLSASDTGYQKMGIAVSATELLIRGY